MKGKVNVGDPAPEFTLYNTGREQKNFRDFMGKKIVLAFYPGAFTAGCTREMCAFRDAMAVFNSLDAQVIGVSVNDPFTNQAFAEANDLNYPLLSDYNREAITAYGVVDEDFAGMKGYTAAKRSVFIIDGEGVVRYKWVTDNPGQQPNFQEIEDALKSIS